jgi:chromatin remodeling complex protein RSC6
MAKKVAKKAKPAKKVAKVAKKAKAVKKVAKKVAKVAKPRKPRKPNPQFMKPVTPDTVLAAVVGNEAMPRTEIAKRIWAYIKSHKLQDNRERRNINADDKLQAIFGKKTVNMFEMTKLVNQHVKK